MRPVVDAVVLAGGAGRRLGGVSKGEVELAGQRLVDHVLAATGAARRVVVVGEVPVPEGVLLTREEPPGGGPAAGVVAGLARLAARPGPAADWVLLLACDLPGAGEAVPELLEIKTSIFTTLDDIVRDNCVLATNTSSLSITEIAKSTKEPSRVIGMHFFNPAPVLPLVEVIHSLLTDVKLVEDVRELAVRLGKKPVVVGDRAGFVANALLIAYLARSIRAYETGLASREDLDAAMAAGVGFPMGPLTLCDLIGLDVVHDAGLRRGRQPLVRLGDARTEQGDRVPRDHAPPSAGR